MAVTIKSGTVEFVRRVRQYLEDYRRDDAGVVIPVAVSLGWRERARQDNQTAGRADRIVFTPSADDGRSGQIAAVRGPGLREIRTPEGVLEGKVRGLYTWEQLMTCSVWAAPPPGCSRDDEEAQIGATEDLFEWALQAVYHSGLAAVQPGEAGWTVSPVHTAFGKEMRFTFTLRQDVFDKPRDVRFPGHSVPRPWLPEPEE